MRTLACFAAAGMLAVFASARAGTVAYGEAFDTLYRIDLDSHTATTVGAAGYLGNQLIGNLAGLSYSSDGTLYAVAGTLNALARIDPDSGEAQVVGSFGLAGQGDPQRQDALDLGMTFGCDGSLWLVSAYAGRLWKVDPATATTTLVGPTGHTITGIVARGNVLLGAGGKGDNNLYRIDPSTGAATLIGAYGSAAGSWIASVSMSFDDAGTLWAVLNYVPPAPGSTSVPEWSDLARIDPDTGAVTIVGPITGPDALREVGIKGFAIGPPRCVAGVAPTGLPSGSPLSMILLWLMLAGAAGAALHRRLASA